MKEHICEKCEHEKECLNMVCFYELLEKEEGKIRVDEREKAIKDFAEWLPLHFDLRFSSNPKVWVDEFFNHTSEKILEQLKKEQN